MAYFKWTSEYRALVKRLYEQGMNTRQVIDYFYDHYGLNVSRRSVQRYRKGATHTPVKETKIKDVARGTEIVLNKDGSQSSSTTLQMTSEQAKDPDFVLRAHGFDPTEWDIISARNNFWQQNSQENGLIDLYQSKITVKPKADNVLTPQDIVAMFKSDIEPFTVAQKARSEHNLVVALPDLHFGITKRGDVQGHIEMLIDVINRGFKTIVIEQLGDLLHSSQMWTSQTLKGTILDKVNERQAWEDAKWFFDVLVPVALENSTKVYVKQMAGNHSGNMEFAFMDYLQVKYPQLAVHNNIDYRGAYLLDNVGIMLAHGDLAPKNLPMLFANEFGGVWSLAHSREIHKGHFHREKIIDEGGVISRQIGTVKPNDNYEIMNGWTLSKKELYALEYDSDKLVAEWHV